MKQTSFCQDVNVLQFHRSSSGDYELLEVGLVTCGGSNNCTINSSNAGGTLLHCSLSSQNYLAAVMALDVER